MTNGEMLFRALFRSFGAEWDKISDDAKRVYEDDAARYEALKAEVVAKLNGAEVAK